MANDGAIVFALVQVGTVAGDVDASVRAHVAVVREAADAGARVVAFPELSLTGYELARIAVEPDLTLTADDLRLEPLRTVAIERQATVLVGAPLLVGTDRVLACLVLDPDGAVTAYAKRNLYEDEREVFTPGASPLTLDLDGVRLAVGICADLADSRQVDELAAADVDAWVLGVLVSESGYATDAGRAQRAADLSGARVLLANHAQPTGGWIPAGGSGVWLPGGGGRRLGADGTDPRADLIIVHVGRRPR